MSDSENFLTTDRSLSSQNEGNKEILQWYSNTQNHWLRHWPSDYGETSKPISKLKGDKIAHRNAFAHFKLNISGTENLRAGDWKYRELVDKSEKSDFFIFCQKKPFGELFMKIQVKLFKDFLFSRNLEKREIPGSDLGVQQILLENCAFLTLACKKLQNRINTIFWTSIELCLFMRKM